MKQTYLYLMFAAMFVAIAAIVVYLVISARQKDSYSGYASAGAPPGQAPATPPARTGDRPAGEPPVLALFYGDWCPHCTTMKPDWAKVKEALAGSPVKVVEFESKNPIAAPFQIEGYPTIRLYPAGFSPQHKFMEHKGQRTAQAIMDFVTGRGPKA